MAKRGRKKGSTTTTSAQRAKSSAIQSMKRAFSRSEFARKIRDKATIPGLSGPRGGKLCRCYYCGEEEASYLTEVDHVEPVIPVELSALSMTLDMVYRRLFCSEENLVCTCKTCHKAVSKRQLSERAKWRKKKKYLVCRLKGGSKIKVFSIIDLKDPCLHEWEILDYFHTRKEADANARKRRSLRESNVCKPIMK